ncbi:MAG TPA: DUF4394 domain-containing protein [Steroidobacteraceae bacterium]|nr:DUF4394 domain-containing protein [Steroidobacteraceae bacterium]
MTSGDTTAVTSKGRLVTFDRADPALDTAIAISGLQSGDTVVGADFRGDGVLYALGSGGRLYTVDQTTGAATLKSTLAADAGDSTDAFTALSGTEFGIDFNPVSDRLRIVSDTGQNLRVNVDTGATITDAPLTVSGAARTGVNGAGYTNAFSQACRTALYYIDASTDELLTTSDPNGGAATVVGALGVDATSAGDIEIATAADGTNTGYAVLVVGGVPTSYQINLSTGTAASAGAVTRLDTDELVRDTTIAPPSSAPTQQAGEVLALTESNKLISFQSDNPAKLCTSASFSGQADGESIVGIDVRPTDQALYALGSGGHLYTVDTASGALTLKSTLAAALGDVSSPFTTLLGTSFGFDFNPGNDLARVVSDTGLNFRVTPDDGVVTTDVALNPSGAVPAEAAYGNSFVGAGTSFYYTIDSTTDTLQVLGRPSGNAINGDLQAVTGGGLLGVGDVQAVGGFDILGTTSRGLAALTIGSGTSSDLFSVALTTGAASRIDTIGGGEKVRGLAYAKLPVATVFALTADNHLVSFKPLTPGTIDADVTISGLQGTEAIIGIDFRPGNGRLYAVTDQAHVYVVDTATGALSGAVNLTANTLDTTAPFTAFAGTNFGVDFSPADDSLRVASNTGQNVRVNVDNGSVITDGDLAGTIQTNGAANSNNFTGSPNTTLYFLDNAAGALIRMTSSTGATATVGPFNAGTTFMAGGDLDIVGGENGLPVAALQPTGSTGSTLYRVNIGNGALTSLGAIGTGSTVVKSVAVRLAVQ